MKKKRSIYRRAALTLLAFALFLCLYWYVTDTGPDVMPWQFNVEVTTDKPRIDAQQMRIDSAPDFEFAMGEGSGLHGLQVFRVNASGQATYTFEQGPMRWLTGSFTLSPAELATIRQALVDTDYPSLGAVYHNRSIADGTQWCLKVTASGVTKKVYCNNHFPARVRRLSGLVHARILPARAASLTVAAPATMPTAPGAPAWESDLWP